MLADEAAHVIGVDTHRDSHTAAVVETATGVVGPHATTSADPPGHKRMLAFAREHAPGSRVWAIESSGSFGAGLTAYLPEHSERVVEVDRPKRPARRSGAKSDELDAIRAAKEALERKHLAQPRRRGEREAVRVLLRTREGAIKARSQATCQLKALVVSAPEVLRSRLRRLSGRELVRRCACPRAGAARSGEQRMTIVALRSTAGRVRQLDAEIEQLEAELWPLLERICPALVAEPGVGLHSAAELLNAWSHRGRMRSDAAFAMLGGAAPIPASSGQTVRHRLNRGGDRQLNRALHTIATSRLQYHPETRAYAARRLAEGKTPREVKRCLKRYLARRIFRPLEAEATMA
jgi:transposase